MQERLNKLFEQHISNMKEWLNDLPPAPKDGACSHCQDRQYYHIIIGLEQWCTLEVVDEDDTKIWWAGYTDGWDDITEAGLGTYVECQTCHALYRPPKQIDWQ